MINNRNSQAFMQSDFYRKKFRRVLYWLMASTMLAFLLLVADIYMILNQPRPAYYGNTTNGKILSMPQPQ